MTVKVRAALPANDYDGLQVAAQHYREATDAAEGDTKPIILIVEAFLDRVIVHMNGPADQIDYVVAVRHVEMLTDSGDASFARSLLATRYEARTGKTPLPFGTLFDPTTSEPKSDDDDGT